MSAVQDFADRVTVADLERDPYPVFARLRADAPVCHVPAVDLWLVTRWADVARVGNEPDAFTADVADNPVNRAFGRPNILTSTDEAHLEIRRSLDTKYRPREVARYIDDLVEPIVADALAGLEGRDSVDLLHDYFEPVSVRSLGQVLGVGHIDAGTLQQWFRGLAEGAVNFENDPARQAISDATSREVESVLGPVLDRLEREPDGSTIAHMLWSGRDGAGPRPRSSVLPSLKVILLGGMQEPGHGAATTAYGLLSDRAELDWVLADLAERVPAAIEEGLRWVSPIGTQARMAVTDVELGGVVVPAGAKVSAVLSSANRDAAVFDDPDTFMVRRTSRKSVPFGFGLHFCVGHAFARTQMRIALVRLLERYPALSLDPSRPVAFRGWEFRAPVDLWVHLTPEPSSGG